MNEIQTINVGAEILREHKDIVNDCKRYLPKKSKLLSFHAYFSETHNSITTVCCYICKEKEEFQTIIWKGGAV